MAQLATFDTHKYIKELTASGFDEKQAEVIIKSILEGRDYDVSNLATKEQLIKTDNKLNILDSKIENTRKELKKDIATLDNKIENTKQELKKDIEINKKELKKDIEIATSRLEASIIKWMVGLLSPLYIGVAIALVKWLM